MAPGMSARILPALRLATRLTIQRLGTGIRSPTPVTTTCLTGVLGRAAARAALVLSQTTMASVPASHSWKATSVVV